MHNAAQILADIPSLLCKHVALLLLLLSAGDEESVFCRAGRHRKATRLGARAPAAIIPVC